MTLTECIEDVCRPLLDKNNVRFSSLTVQQEDQLGAPLDTCSRDTPREFILRNIWKSKDVFLSRIATLLIILVD